MTVQAASTDRIDHDPLAPAGVEYHGVAGSSQDCQAAILRLLQCGPKIAAARLVTAGNHHCVLLTTDVGDPIAVKSGFASGYGGSGPSALAACLQLLEAHGAEIDEWIGDNDMLERFDDATLTHADVNAIVNGSAVRPSRWSDYVSAHNEERARDGTLWREFSPVVPFAIIEPRIMDLALAFWDAPDVALFQGYRRLEDIVRARIGSTESSVKLFSKAFNGKDAPLTWSAPDEGEITGRAQLFAAVFMAFRNPLVHREANGSLAEFLLLNQLFLLEAQAVPREPVVESQKGTEADSTPGA